MMAWRAADFLGWVRGPGCRKTRLQALRLFGAPNGIVQEYYIPPVGAKKNIGPHGQGPASRGETAVDRRGSAKWCRADPAIKDLRIREDQCTNTISLRPGRPGHVAQI